MFHAANCTRLERLLLLPGCRVTALVHELPNGTTTRSETARGYKFLGSGFNISQRHRIENGVVVSTLFGPPPSPGPLGWCRINLQTN